MWPFSTPYPEKKSHEVTGQAFDYVVVGGGTAGCAIAARLSEDPDVSVLVLERGAVSDHWLSRVPMLSGSLARQLFPVVHQLSEPMAGCDGRRTDLWSGAVLGGASRINQMLYTRGVPGMYNEWAAMGHPGWSWRDVEPFFQRIENCVSHPAADHLGHSGPLHIVQHAPQFELHNHIDKAAAAVGLPIAWDVNDPSGPAAGYFYLDYTIDQNGHRHSAYRAYLPKKVAIARASRLTICTGVVASRLELDAVEGTATGVHIRPANSAQSPSFFVKARREVIVSCGAMGSPQLLMLSGIGPQEHLSQAGVPVKADLPGVGANLSDHNGIPVMLKMPVFESFHRMESNPLWAIWQILRFLWDGSGWMKAGSTTSTIFLNTSNIDPTSSTLQSGPQDSNLDGFKPENVPDLEIMVFPACAVVGQFSGLPLLTLYTCLLQPKTLGRIELASLDPEASPRVHYKMMDDPEDVATARRALRFTLNLAEKFMKSSGYQHPVELFHSPKAQLKPDWRDLSDEDLDGFVRASAQSVVHLGCSCRMAKKEDGGVVDDELRVYGFKNLRVADASVFPKIPSAHTMAPTYVVAERCAQFIKDQWKLK
jgi:choline dehydrogenase-like flavoprotein